MQRYFRVPIWVQPSLGPISMKLGIDVSDHAHQKNNKSYDVFKSHNFINVVK